MPQNKFFAGILLVIFSWLVPHLSSAFTPIPLVVVSTPIAIIPVLPYRLIVSNAALYGAKTVVRTGNTLVVHHPSFAATLTANGWDVKSRTFCYSVQGVATGFFDGIQELAPTTDFAGGFDVANFGAGANPSLVWSGGVFGQIGGHGRVSNAFNCTYNYQNFLDGTGLFNLSLIPTMLVDASHSEINHQNNAAVFFDRHFGAFFQTNILSPNPTNVTLVQNLPSGNPAFVSSMAEIPGSPDMVYAINPTAVTSEVYRFSISGSANNTLLFNTAQILAHTGLPVCKITALTADANAIYFYESFADLIIRFDRGTAQFSTLMTGPQIMSLDGTLQSNVVDLDIRLNAADVGTHLYLLTSGSTAAGAKGAVIDLNL